MAGLLERKEEKGGWYGGEERTVGLDRGQWVGEYFEDDKGEKDKTAQHFLPLFKVT